MRVVGGGWWVAGGGSGGGSDGSGPRTSGGRETALSFRAVSPEMVIPRSPISVASPLGNEARSATSSHARSAASYLQERVEGGEASEGSGAWVVRGGFGGDRRARGFKIDGIRIDGRGKE